MTVCLWNTNFFPLLFAIRLRNEVQGTFSFIFQKIAFSLFKKKHDAYSAKYVFHSNIKCTNYLSLNV